MMKTLYSFQKYIPIGVANDEALGHSLYRWICNGRCPLAYFYTPRRFHWIFGTLMVSCSRIADKFQWPQKGLNSEHLTHNAMYFYRPLLSHNKSRARQHRSWLETWLKVEVYQTWNIFLPAWSTVFTNLPITNLPKFCNIFHPKFVKRASNHIARNIHIIWNIFLEL